MKKDKNFIFKYLKKRQKENQRDISYFESDLFNFLKFIYRKGPVNEKIIQKRTFSEIRYDELKSFAIEKKYIVGILGKTLKYDLTHEGKEFLLDYQKTKSEKSNTNIITLATIILAISAAVSIIDLLLKNEETKNFIILNLGKAVAGILEFVIAIFIIILGSALIWFIIKGIIKIIKKSEPQ